jgi:hypothetical protein
MSAEEATDAGFSPAQLEEAGYTPEEVGGVLEGLKNDPEAAMTVEKASDAGYTPEQMEEAGYTPEEVGGVLADQKAGGMTASQASEAGYSPALMEQAGFSTDEISVALADEKAGGMTVEEASEAGFSPAQIEEAGYTPKEVGGLLAEAKSDPESGMTIAKASEAGYSPAAMEAAGYPEGEIVGLLEGLNAAGTTAREACEMGFTPKQMEAAGYAPEAIARLLPAYKAAGWTASQAMEAGFSAAQIAQAGYPPAAIVNSLAGKREGGMSAEEANDKGYSPAQLEQAGYAAETLGRALSDKRTSGWTASQASDAGYSPSVLRAASYTPEEVGGVLADQKAGGMTASQASAVGYSPEDLSAAGFAQADIDAAAAAAGLREAPLARQVASIRQVAHAHEEGAAASLSAEPVFLLRGEETRFWLPVRTPTPLLKVEAAPGVSLGLTGETFGASASSQTFGSYELRLNGELTLRVAAGVPGGAPNWHALKTMRLWINGAQVTGSINSPELKSELKALHTHGIALHTRKLPRATEVGRRLFLAAEEVTLVSEALKMTIWSSPQRKVEQGGEPGAPAEAHLNLDLDWAKGKAKGLVAELSGERDMSRAARLLLKPPPGIEPTWHPNQTTRSSQHGSKALGAKRRPVLPRLHPSR